MFYKTTLQLRTSYMFIFIESYVKYFKNKICNSGTKRITFNVAFKKSKLER